MVEERFKVAINPEYPEQTVMIGSTLTEEGRNKLCNLLQGNLNIFAWKPADMTGVPRHIAEHRLNVREGLSGGSSIPQTDWQKSIRGHLSSKAARKRRDVFLGNKVKYQIAESSPDKRDVCLLSTSVPKMLKRRAKVKRKAHKPEQKSDFHWTTEAEEAFKQMKQLIAELPMLTAPIEKEELIIYLVAAKETISAVLMTKREAKQMPIYFVSRVLSRPEVAGRLQKWSIELGEYAILYRPRVSVKGQILADFIVERLEEDSSDTLTEVEELHEPWILFTDGSSCTDGSGAGLILTNPEGIEFTYALRFRFDATNNEAEYEALIAGLRIAE
ncbi:reverse transcriptase domain-containing protein [Tanacetum coccineum]